LIVLPDGVIKALFGIPIGLTAIAFLAVGAVALVTKRPVFVAARIYLWLLTLLIGGLAVAQISFLFSPYRDSLNFMSVLQAAILALVLVVFWRQMQGYFVLGVSEEPFREALIGSLEELNLEHKETVRGFELSGLADLLQVSVQGWVGTAQLRMNSRRNNQLFMDLLAVLRRRLADGPGRAGLFIPITYSIMGLLMLAFAIYLALEL
jgi:hypothetical protein